MLSTTLYLLTEGVNVQHYGPFHIAFFYLPSSPRMEAIDINNATSTIGWSYLTGRIDVYGH